MPKRNDGAPQTLLIQVGDGNLGAPGTDAFRLYVPDKPDLMKGWAVRGARLSVTGEANTATATLDIQNQTTTMLSSTVSLTANGTSAATMANDGQEIVAPGRFISVDLTAGAGTWNTTSYFQRAYVQIDYDVLG